MILAAKQPSSQAKPQKHPQMLVSTPCTAIPQYLDRVLAGTVSSPGYNNV